MSTFNAEKTGSFNLYRGLADQKERTPWPRKIGKTMIVGIISIFIARAVIEVLVQNFLHRI